MQSEILDNQFANLNLELNAYRQNDDNERDSANMELFLNKFSFAKRTQFQCKIFFLTLGMSFYKENAKLFVSKVRFV